MKLYCAQSIFDAIYLLAISKEYQQTTTFYHNSITKPFFLLNNPMNKNPPTFITLKYFRNKHDTIRNKYKDIIYIMLRVYIIIYKLNER